MIRLLKLLLPDLEVGVFDWREGNGRYYLLMEKVRGIGWCRRLDLVITLPCLIIADRIVVDD